MVIVVFGLGFVGLTLSLGLADLGHTVYGLDSDDHKINLLNQGIVPFKDPGVNDLLAKHLRKNFHLINTNDLPAILKRCGCVFYCVGTPSDEEGRADITCLKEAIKTTMEFKSKDRHLVLIIKSTVPPGTCLDELCPFIDSLGYIKGNDYDLVHNPEFLREGHSLEDFMNAEKIVAGAEDGKAFETIKAVYSGLHSPIYEVSLTTAEYIKYLSNTLLATLISFSNEMAESAEILGDIDIKKAFQILHTDKRLKNSGIKEYIYPGCGYGGYCLPKDTKGLYHKLEDNLCNVPILNEVIKRNEKMARLSAEKITKECKKEKETKIGILGLSFKPGSDDVRESPSIKIIRELIAMGYCNINAYDPVANENFKRSFPSLGVKTYNSISELEYHSDLLVIATAWQQFKDFQEKTYKPVVNLRYM